MDKKSIAGIAVIALLFVGFTWFNSYEKKKFEKAHAEWQARQDSLLAAQQPEAVETPDIPEVPDVADADSSVDSSVASAQSAQASVVGDLLAQAGRADAEEFTVENDVMTVRFSTRGGRITGVTLKDYDRYAPKGEQGRPVELFDPASARFALTFFLKIGTRNVPVNTMDYTFSAAPVRTSDEGTQSVVMRLPVSEGAWLEYEYLIYNAQTPQRDYLVDFDVRLVNMAPEMAGQSTLGIEWSNLSYQNERGFKNENMYTTVAYRFPGESSIEELGMSDERKSKNVSTAVGWVAFKQQFFSSVFIAPENFSYADMAFATAQPGSSHLYTSDAADEAR
ncbi:MAG: membrane protein insertase YidC, partial [Alistipes sp.]|nr:membrane protein insertase YidC [Alistipes sp.]